MPESRWKSGTYGDSALPLTGMTSPMRVMFFTWLVLIATGLVFYTVIGLAHN